jgi:hypothetical protein
MNPRIVLALACAAALLIGLTAWLRVDRSAPHVTQVDADTVAASTASSPAELIAPDSASTSSASRTAAPRETNPTARTASSLPFPHPVGHGPRLSGVVTTKADGRPLQSATVTAQLEGETDELGGKLMTFITDANGYYSIGTLPAGDWLLSCVARGHENADRRVTIVPDKEVRADFVLVPETGKADLVVRLRATDGRPLLETLDGPEKESARALRPVFLSTCPARDVLLTPGAPVLPIRASGVHAPQADEWFEVKFDAKSSGCCCLALGDRVLDAVPFSAASHDIVLVASSADLKEAVGSLRCSVVDDTTGESLLANVVVRPAAGALRHGMPDANDIIRVDHLLEGEAQVQVNAMNHAPANRTVKIERGAEIDLGVIRLAPYVSISGRVPAPQGKLPWRAVFAHRIPDDKHVAEDFGFPASVRLDGQFTFDGVEPGRYLIGWQSGAAPELKPVQTGLIAGWTIVDARSRSVEGVQIVITENMLKSTPEWTRSNAHRNE